MGYTVFSGSEHEWQERDDGSGRHVARLSDAMTQARANLWRYPAGARGKRHADRVQEETFVIVAGTLSMLLGDPPERAELSPGSVVVVQPGTPLQIRNDGATRRRSSSSAHRRSRAAPTSSRTSTDRR